ncbi:bifunctional proline dehydrogenase/L-glutamate gamma-semialdehyde dehydrogenase PutA [Pontixanthobacter sp.]|uniref:bifunctional proline dehydrogenase/L-glutamate gamma-semialdehyde dehydrogenase PutA n=1 Tax=Pontixanthobacter sp. TaxID=2792078 RepID=UPI003C7D0E38
MNITTSALTQANFGQLAAAFLADERACLQALSRSLQPDAGVRDAAYKQAKAWVEAVRANGANESLLDAFMREFNLSNNEGVVLMRLSEALIRTPDPSTAMRLVRDKLLAGDWGDHAGASDKMLVNAGVTGLRLSKSWIEATGGEQARSIAAKLGDKVMLAAMKRAMDIIARDFVLGATIEKAVATGKSAGDGDRYSFDMLGEAARTQHDAANFFSAYSHAIAHLASQSQAHDNIHGAPSVSVKLSALHPRYEPAQADICVKEITERLLSLAAQARDANIGLIIDAEEADRLEISLDIFQRLINAPGFEGWDGLGIVIQAYQRRCAMVIDTVIGMAREANRRICVRLVKGAYWDMEIKRAQELGLESYPVFTRKEHSDLSFVAGAQQLLNARDIVYPQFATHNALSAATIFEMAKASRDGVAGFEFQRLHGMGADLHAEITRATGLPSRIYAPVGAHKELLPYLVRRLLENGANSSFVSQINNPDISVDEIVADPLADSMARDFAPHPRIKAPRDLFDGLRLSAKGEDFTQNSIAARLDALASIPHLDSMADANAGANANAAWPAGSGRHGVPIGCAARSDPQRAEADTAVPPDRRTLGQAMNRAEPSTQMGGSAFFAPENLDDALNGFDPAYWRGFTPEARSGVLVKIADLMEQEADELMLLCVQEAGKTWDDAQAELREAVDFCRYYALEALAPENAKREPLGTVACISPWNFPLAIFSGQIAAALVMGNGVLAKPAHQTPRIAERAVDLFQRAGVPVSALALLPGGRALGAALVVRPEVDGICFTGSTKAAQAIARARADMGKASAPLIAETGGINAMIVDSTALLEQAVMDVVDSAFQSAGQRCSACRIVCVQEGIADEFNTMLAGAMVLLRAGYSGDLSTDTGPLIDAEAHGRIGEYVEHARAKFRVIGEAPAITEGGPPKHNDGPSHSSGQSYFQRPIAFAVPHVRDVQQEVFGPVLHVVRFAADGLDALIDDINALGFGLTMGLHTRIDTRVEHVRSRARVGNLYINRNQIGAVVGVQPFGGEGLSGTGPKAGGPHYLGRLSKGGGRCSMPAISMPEPKRLEDDAAGVLTKLETAYCSAPAHPYHTAQLPGPTGEENTLSLYPRGVILCVCHPAEPQRLALMIDRLLETGNIPVVAAEDADVAGIAGDQSRAIIVGAGPADIARYGAISGVLASRELAESVSAIVAQRDGALLPVLDLEDSASRFFNERTLTINTTAAGGNASLMSL